MDKNAQKQLGKSVIWNTLGNIVYYASQYVLLILVTRMSADGSYASGILSTAMSIAAIALSISNYGMRSYQISDFEHRFTDAAYLRSRMWTVLAAALGSVVFALAVSYSAEQRWAIVLYTVCRLSEGYIDVWHGFLQKTDRMDLVGLLFGLRGLVTMAGFAAGMLLTHNLTFTLALLAVLNWLCVFAADVPSSRKAAQLKATGGGSVSSLLWACAPLAVYSILNSSIGSVVKLFCERVCGTALAGSFNNVFAPVQIIQVGAMYIFAPFMMLFARHWAEKNKAAYLKAFGVAAAAIPVLWALGAVAAALLGRFFLRLLYGEEILAFANLLQPAVIAAVTNIFVSILCYLLSMMREMKGLILGNVAGILAALAFSVPALQTMGVAGAAYVTVAARAVQAAVCLVFMLRRCRTHFVAEA